MKKFLSLLLALTLVLSLVVVPARATDTLGGANAVDKGKTIELTATAPTGTVPVPTEGGSTENKTIAPDSDIRYSWSSSDPTIASVAAKEDFSKIGVVRGVKPSNEAVTITCTMTVTYIKTAKVVDQNGNVTTPEEFDTTEVTQTKSVTVNDAIAASEVASITFNGRTYTGNSAIYYINDESSLLENTTNSAQKWSVTPVDPQSNLRVTGTSVSGSKVTINLTRGTAPAVVNGSIVIDAKQIVSSGAISVTPATADNYREGMTFSLALPSNFVKSNLTTFVWTAKKSSDTEATSINNPTAWKPISKGTYTISCVVKENGTVVGENPITKEVVINEETYSTYKVDPASSAAARATVNFEFAFRHNRLANEELLKNTAITWKVTGGNATIRAKGAATSSTTSTANGAQSASLYTGTSAANLKVTAEFTYLDKKYTVEYTTIRVTVLEATLASVQSGGSATYYNSDFISAAQTALNNRTGISSYYETVQSVGAATQISSNTYGYHTNNSIGSTNGRLDFRAGTAFGAAQYSATVRTRVGNTNTYNDYTITFNIPVSPAKVAYEDQYPEPVAYGNTYRYAVSVPSGYTYYYVVGSVNQTAEPTWSTSGTRYSSNNLYYLTDSNFVGGKCTLWLLTVDSRGAYSCGQLTVYQQNYNINYNGVAGETVQFAQSDFNDFMNKVAEARGDASKTKSYPYVTFDSVTFSLPTTAQGTLYYGGTAMSTSNSSGAFNTRTKVTNLDSVTFAPNAKTTAKAITLNFTLYATRYSTSSTSRGTTVSYSGSVVVNLVREDIKYTVSQGDSVRFDESDFLNYLRSTKGYSSNNTIDYVTFDQSAVSAVNEGSLYTYYNGYNYGGSVKTTDKFYYNATASQNALSDVAFLASRYAKTGETVYIPFTIYARYGTTGTGTRQLTGTVAIKIGQTMNFIDVKTTDYFYNSVKWAVGKNITNGTSSTTFSPYKSCTRAEIVTFLWRAAGSPEPTVTRNPFRDVNAVTHSSYYKAILWASQKGITSGTSTTAFSPDQVCTRAQIVTFLYRYAGQPSGYYSNPFKDVGATSEASYYKAILWAVGKGITTGTSATTFSPYASCNRAEAVTFLYRYTNGL